MVKQVFLPLAAVMIFITALGLYLKNNPQFTSHNAAPTPHVESMTIGQKEIQVEIAKNSIDRAKGLGDRTSLDPNSGMLFVFDSQNVYPDFWMKGMLIPLDIIWINDSSVVKIDKNAPAPSANTPDDQLKTYSVSFPVDQVLEVNAGFSDKNGIKVGDAVSLPAL